MNRRVLPAVGAAIAALFLGNGIYATLNNNTDTVATDVRHKVDLVASVNTVSADPNWKQDGVTSNGSLRLSPDDLCLLTVP